MAEHSSFIRDLARILAENPLHEKILLAPSHRVGRQWLDRAAAFAGTLANTRAATFRRLILDHADAALKQKRLAIASAPQRLAALGQTLARLRRESNDAGYFTRLSPSLELAQTIQNTLDDLDRAGAAPAAHKIAAPDKAAELPRIARLHADDMRRRKLATPGAILRAALAAPLADDPNLPLLILPQSVADDLSALERRFWRNWPASRKRTVLDDLGPCQAEAAFFAADTIANEARETLRRIQALDLPLDHVEVVCLDHLAYTPALVDAALETFGGRPEDLPITFNGGIPGCYAKPVRLVAAWLEWLENSLPPEGLARIVEAGLLGDGWRRHAPRTSASALAARLRAIAVDGTPAGYQTALRAESSRPDTGRAAAWLANLLAAIVPVDTVAQNVDVANADALLSAVANLLDATAGADGKLDAYARVALVESVAEWRDAGVWPGFDARAWLAALAANLYVMGLGPLPGRLHVGELRSGGHSGRECTFVVGLDDSRFPGSFRQDPVLLDKERAAISPDLARSGQRRLRREKEIERLLARVGGRLFLSHSRRESGDGRELFPAAVYLRMARERGVAPHDIPLATLVPDAPDKCLNRRDDWLGAVLERRRNSLTAADLAPWHPGLAAGSAALSARAGTRFTEYDGYVPEAGRHFSGHADDWAVSPTDLELLAASPLDFFFKRILGVKPPDRYEPTPGRWLDGNVRGNLLHDLFQRFLFEAADDPDGGAARFQRMIDESIASHRLHFPPRDELAFLREERELREAAAIFMAAEKERRRFGKPVCLEVALGLPASSTPSRYDRAEPVALPLPSGRVLRLKGRIDRVDRLDAGGLELIDYKTGRSDDYSAGDPFRKGRHLQPLLYTHMLTRVLEESGLSEPIRRFAYFFPMPRDEGRVVPYPREVLGEEGLNIVERLLDLLAGGAFPFATRRDDVKFSDYADVHAAAGETTRAALAKAEADDNAELSAWRELIRL